MSLFAFGPLASLPFAAIPDLFDEEEVVVVIQQGGGNSAGSETERRRKRKRKRIVLVREEELPVVVELPDRPLDVLPPLYVVLQDIPLQPVEPQLPLPPTWFEREQQERQDLIDIQMLLDSIPDPAIETMQAAPQFDARAREERDLADIAEILAVI